MVGDETAADQAPGGMRQAAQEWDRILRPRSGWAAAGLQELWQYRELLLFLAWRNLLVRYKQTVAGILWTVIQPLAMMAIFTLVFGHLGKFPSHGVPYALLALAGILPYQHFSNALAQGSNSVVGAQSMVEKIYFPRLYLPAAELVAGSVDLLVSLVILFLLMFWYGAPFRVELLTLPLFIAMNCVAALGITLFFSALNVKYRDVRQLVPFVVRAGMYLSPVGFVSGVIPAKWRVLYGLNPVVGVIDGFRWAVLGDRFALHWPSFWASLAVTVISALGGFIYFRRAEKTFADVI